MCILLFDLKFYYISEHYMILNFFGSYNLKCGRRIYTLKVKDLINISLLELECWKTSYIYLFN